MIALGMVMRDVLTKHFTQMRLRLAQRDDLRKALLSCRAYEPFGVRVYAFRFGLRAGNRTLLNPLLSSSERCGSRVIVDSWIAGVGTPRSAACGQPDRLGADTRIAAMRTPGSPACGHAYRRSRTVLSGIR
jgi:hypothetical protein